MSYKEKDKVFAYILRSIGAETALLIFFHRDYPEAGWQVPAGTVEASEEKLSALKREVKEESGLDRFLAIKYLGYAKFIREDRKEIHHRYFYQLNDAGNSSITFQHIVTGNDEDEGLVLDYKWVVLKDLPPLAGQHDQLLHLLETV